MTEHSKKDGAHARESAEPAERTNPVPWLLGLVAASLSVWGVAYFLLTPTDMSTAASRPKAGGGTAVPAAVDGAQIFAGRCASCHQATGAGMPGVFPPLANSAWVNGDEKTVARILLLGIVDKITVSGATYSGVMPAFGASLTNEELAAVASYVRANFGNKSPAITVEVIKSERAKLGTRATPWAGEDELKAQH